MSSFSKLLVGSTQPKKREKTGLWELTKKDATVEGCVDIVAIHGLGGDAYGT